MEAVARSGFGERGRITHLFVGGSELHGAKVKDTDDLDIYGAVPGSRKELLTAKDAKGSRRTQRRS